MFFAGEYQTAGPGLLRISRGDPIFNPKRRANDAQSDSPGCTTLSKSVRVQRGGNYKRQIGNGQDLAPRLRPASSEPIAKAGDLFVFQQQDHAVERVVVDRLAFRMITEALWAYRMRQTLAQLGS